MAIGDVVYLKSGGPALTVVRDADDRGMIGVNWFNGLTIISTELPEAATTALNPEPSISAATKTEAAKYASAQAAPVGGA